MVTTPLFPPSFAPQVPLIRKIRTAHFRGALVQKCDFGRRDITLCCVSIAKRSAGKTNKLLQGLIRDGAPRAPVMLPHRAPGAVLHSNSAAGSRHARRARSCIVVHFTCSFVAERFKSTFHVFDNELAKTFHFCAADIHSLTAHYICAKISRPEQGRILSLIAHCALAQDTYLFDCFLRVC